MSANAPAQAQAAKRPVALEPVVGQQNCVAGQADKTFLDCGCIECRRKYLGGQQKP